MNLSPQEHQTITQLTQGIGAGIGGLIEMALANDGPGAAAASLAAVKAGRAHVELKGTCAATEKNRICLASTWISRRDLTAARVRRRLTDCPHAAS